MMENPRDAVAALVHRYAELLDGGDLDALADLFAHATLRSNQRPAVRSGRQDALALYRDTVILYDGSPCTKHVLTNLAIDLDADGTTATARTHFAVLQARPELPLQVVLAGRYHDRFTLLDGTWHFADRLILVDLVGDLRWHARRR
jgi:3-phenylpropionate/cinnamic acid dioxygenase small subunit